MKKLYFLGLPVLILALGFVLAGCPDATESPGTTEPSGTTEPPDTPDTWSAVTSLDQLNGIWKGSGSQTQDIGVLFGERWTTEMAEMFGDMKITTSVEITLTIDASLKFSGTSGNTVATYSGGNITDVWEYVKENMASEDGATVDDTKHSIASPFSDNSQLTDAEILEMLAGLQINQNGIKVIIPAGQLGDGVPEMTVVKQ